MIVYDLCLNYQIMKTVCPECSTEFKGEPGKVISPKGSFKYQCHCFFVTDGIEIFGSDNDCPCCLTKQDSKTVFKCGHWVCDTCFTNYKSDNCPICSAIYNQYGEKPKNVKKNDHQIAIPDELKTSFQKLYKRVFSFINRYVFLDYSTHFKTIILLEEYYKWLTILAEHGGANELSPGSLIDKVWHEHILDLEDYLYVCNKVAGRILYHYPEHSFNCVKRERLQRQWNADHHYVKKYGKYNDLTKIYWHFWAPGRVYQEYSVIPHWQLFVKDLDGITVTFPFTENTTIDELKLMITEYNGLSPCEQRLIFAGRQLEDGKVLHKDYKIQKESTIHLVLRLTGC